MVDPIVGEDWLLVMDDKKIFDSLNSISDVYNFYLCDIEIIDGGLAWLVGRLFVVTSISVGYNS